MFSKIFLERYADIMVWALNKTRKRAFGKGDLILLQYGSNATELAENIYERLLSLGAHIVQRATPTSRMERSFYEKADDKQLVFLPPGDTEFHSQINGKIFIYSPSDLTNLQNISPIKIGKFISSRKNIMDIVDERERKGAYGWTLCVFPTQAMSASAAISFNNYAKRVAEACFLNTTNPTQKWEEVFTAIHEIKAWLNSLRIKEVFLESKNCDLKITIGEGRRWLGVSGHNIPSFEIFTSPDYRFTEGRFLANLPSYKNGNLVKNLKITFSKGSLVTLDADVGAEFARKVTGLDNGAARVGEFSLTDKRFSPINRFMADTLFDENFGGNNGNCHIALGRSYLDTYSKPIKNLTKSRQRELGYNDSVIHWDIINTEKKTVKARLSSGKIIVIYEDGIFRC